MSAVWRGTEAEALRLTAAVLRFCTCRRNGEKLVEVCALHKAMVDDQLWLDRLLFQRRCRYSEMWNQEMVRGEDFERHECGCGECFRVTDGDQGLPSD